tara:strand:- start:85 stop:456 length:372 start_codon:yes stop_codon:yes gene_type:complete
MLALLIPCSLQSSQTGTRPSARSKFPIICASLNHPFLIVSLLRYLAEKILFFSAANFRGSATQTPVNFKTASPATALVKASVLGYSVPKLEISCNETGEIFDYCMLYFRNQRLVANPLFFIPE